MLTFFKKRPNLALFLLWFVGIPLHALLIWFFTQLLSGVGWSLNTPLKQEALKIPLLLWISTFPLLAASLYARYSLARGRIFGARLIPLFFGSVQIFGFLFFIRPHEMQNLGAWQAWVSLYGLYALPLAWNVALLLWAIFIRAPRSKPRAPNPLDEILAARQFSDIENSINEKSNREKSP